MFWLQLSTLVLINLLIVALIVSSTSMRFPLFTRAQHGSAGQGDYNVWELIAQVEAERDRAVDRQGWPPQPLFPDYDRDYDPDDEPTGRHHLRT